MKISGRVLTVICIAVLSVSQACFLAGAGDSAMAAEKVGETFTVRVGYFGDDTDYRIKAQFSNSEMRALGDSTRYYTNMTSVGTIMSTVAKGPTLEAVLDEAGIDVGSIKMFHARTTDGDGKSNSWFIDFPASKYIGSTLYYYPNLPKLWERTGDGSGIPKEGALKDGREVDTIIATESYTTKLPIASEDLKPEMMDTENTYRLCAGMLPIVESEETNTVSSNESAKWLLGIDVTLWGSPEDATGLSLNLRNRNLKVGSVRRINYEVTGQELFENKVDKRLKWSSSDNSIATVDSEGNVRIKKKGKVTITAETKNGIKSSIVINGVDEPADSEDYGSGGSGNGILGNDSNEGTGKSAGSDVDGRKPGNIQAMEVSLGEQISNGTAAARVDMPEDTVALTEEEVNPRLILYAGLASVVIFGLGALMRIRRFFMEV